MKFGLTLPNGGAWGDARTLGELGRLAEESGWDGVFLEDYIVWQGHQDVPTTDPWIALAAIALQTGRIRLGTMITPLTRRRPWKLARETVSLDHLSNGRLILGVGIGDTDYDASSFGAFGEVMDAKRRGKMVDEALDVIDRLWSGKPFRYDGEYFHVTDVKLLPRPIQTPRIPIWIGGGYPRKGPTQRALRWDGSCMYKRGIGEKEDEDWTPEDVRTLYELAVRARGADKPFDIALGGRGRGSDWDKERAFIRSLADAGATWWVEYVPPQVGDLDAAQVHCTGTIED